VKKFRKFLPDIFEARTPGEGNQENATNTLQRKDAIERQSIMNNDNPLSPQTSLLDPKQQGRSRVKIAVFSVLAVHVAGLTALLLTQGCKREELPPEVEPQPDVPMLDSNALYYTETNPPIDLATPPLGQDPYSTPYVPPTQPVPPSMPAPSGSEYIVKSGDSFYTIAKNHGTTTKAIEAANPGVDSRRLQIGQKLVLPPPSATTTTPLAPAINGTGENLYIVKSGDTLTRIASRNNTTVKELKALNGLVTDQIKVGQKLKLPPPPAPAPAPLVQPLPSAPTLPPQ